MNRHELAEKWKSRIVISGYDIKFYCEPINGVAKFDVFSTNHLGSSRERILGNLQLLIKSYSCSFLEICADDRMSINNLNHFKNSLIYKDYVNKIKKSLSPENYKLLLEMTY